MGKKKPLFAGTAGALGLLVIFFGVLTALNSLDYAVGQFSGIWYWILILALGFGTQLGLYWHIKDGMREKMTGATVEVAASGGISTGSMMACCAHYLTNVLPILGLSAAAAFLVQYQTSFLLLGIFSNFIGITLMVNIIQRHGLYRRAGLFRGIFSCNIRTLRLVIVILAVGAISLSFLLPWVGGRDSSTVQAGRAREFNLAPKSNDEKFVSIEVKPIKFSYNEPVKFDVTINTHQGSLDFDLTAISLLEDAEGNSYKALTWEGTPPDGHHRAGVLTFPKLKGETGVIKLTLKNVYGIPERVFEWSLR